MILHTNTSQGYFLDTLGTKWFHDTTYTVNNIPAGHKKLLYVSEAGGPTLAQVQQAAAVQPGSVWYILGEPNRRGPNDGNYITVTDSMIQSLHDLYVMIRQVDPTAKITSPSVLNWDFTCNGCGGYKPGHQWMDEFRNAYLAKYGVEPPVDIWAMDVYPIDWSSLPSLRSDVIEAQVTALAFWPHRNGKPIWLTELATLFGYSQSTSCTIGANQYPFPAGTYQTQQVLDYMKTTFDWLETNATAMNIERWFQFISHADFTQCNAGGYFGITLFNGGNPGAALSATGQYYYKRVYHLP